MIVVVAGSSGLIGQALIAHLQSSGHSCRVLVRRPAASEREYQWDPQAGQVSQAALRGADAVVNLAGSPVSARWTRAARERILSSRVCAAATLATAMAATDSGPRILVQASAIGYYGEGGEAELTEESAKGTGFLSEVVERWEAAAGPAREAGARVSFARSGIVLAPGGGALGKLLPIIRLGLGGPIGGGEQWWSWITLRDEVRAIVHLLSADAEGPVNLTAPEPARQREVVRELAIALHRPATLPVPAWALRAALGGFAGEILASQRVVPAVLAASGFEWTDSTIGAAAQWVAAPDH